VRMHCLDQGDVYGEFDFGSEPTRKWHESLGAWAQQQWNAAGKTGSLQSNAYVGRRWKKGSLPPALWSNATLTDNDIIPTEKLFLPKIKLSSGRLTIPATASDLLQVYFGDSEFLLVFTYKP
jgi:hypothetical protein